MSNNLSNRFRKGSGAYQCAVCKKLTRETGAGESGVQLCRHCYDRAGDENSVADGCMSAGEFRQIYGEDPPSWCGKAGAE